MPIVDADGHVITGVQQAQRLVNGTRPLRLAWQQTVIAVKPLLQTVGHQQQSTKNAPAVTQLTVTQFTLTQLPVTKLDPTAAG